MRAVKDAGLSWQIRDVDFCSCAAFNGYLELLRYAHEHGCAWDSETCVDAAAGGTWSAFNTRTRTTAPGTGNRALKLQKRGELALCARAKTEGALMMQKGGTGRAINTRTSTVLTSTFYEISGSRDGDSSSDCG